MKQQKKTIIIISALIFIIILLTNQQVFAENNTISIQKAEYTEDFKKWLELSDEEKSKVIQPRMYDVENTKKISKNPLYRARMITSNVDTTFNLRSLIPNNIEIRNQKDTNSCWAFATLSSLETTIALANYKAQTNTSKVYDYSERHMEYATSKNFLDNDNPIGYNRQVGNGGNWYYAQSYLTNGTGAIDENDMKFENNEDLINLSQIQNKTVTSQVYDTVEFEDYNLASADKKAEIMSQIKQHIQNYGAIYSTLHGNSASSSLFTCYNNETGAKYCSNSSLHPTDHAVSIIGWDDNYPKSNFAENAQPKSNGAWIIRNSWGEKQEYTLSELKQEIIKELQEAGIHNITDPSQITDEMIKAAGFTIEGEKAYMKIGDNGLMYVSYEDCNISKSLNGIMKAADGVDYDNIYQYDNYYPIFKISLATGNIMLSNVFTRNTTEKEYLTQVSIYAPETYTCKVYVNPNGDSKLQKDLQFIKLKAGDTETVNAGYHTLEFEKPIELTGKNFTVVVEIEGTKTSSINLSLESQVEEIKEWNVVEVEKGKCFLGIGNDLNNCQWLDLGQLSTVQSNSNLLDSDSTIKAFTVSKVYDGSLEKIAITKQPTKTDYFEGDNFEKDGMEITAYYNRRNNPTVILKDGEYSITNENNLKYGQTSVKITYNGKSVEQPINVQSNPITNLQIVHEPNVTTYKEGQSFQKDGMVIEAKYKNGATKTITDYKIENGNNLKGNQTEVTISYGRQTVKQSITVTPNPLQSINITKEPNKKEYLVGENFDKTGMIVTGTYQDNDTYEIMDYTIKNATNLTLSQTSVTIEYEGKTTTQEITVKSKATNSNLNDIRTEVQKVQAYYYTNNSQNDYTLINVEINEISRNMDNDKVEYYYYLSPDPNEQDITEWTKITENQDDSNKLQFTIDSRKMTNYNKIANEEVLYLYIKEVAIIGENQSVAVSKSMKLETDKNIETYLDDVKKKNVQSSNTGSSNSNNQSNKNDDTVSSGKLPQTGATSIAIVSLVVMILLGVFFYKKNNKYKDIT